MSNIRTMKDTGSDYPITSSIDGAVYSLISADCVIADMGDEFEMSYNTSSLTATFATGSEALIGGNSYWLTGAVQITLPSNSTFYVCLRIDTSKSNGSTGSIECLTESAIKKGNINEGGVRDLVLYKVTTGSSGVTSVTDQRNIASAGDFGNKVTGTLVGGSTSITLAHSKITTNSMLSFYTSIYGVSPNSVSVSNGSVTLTFDTQDTNMVVAVSIDGSY